MLTWRLRGAAPRAPPPDRRGTRCSGEAGSEYRTRVLRQVRTVPVKRGQAAAQGCGVRGESSPGWTRVRGVEILRGFPWGWRAGIGELTVGSHLGGTERGVGGTGAELRADVQTGLTSCPLSLLRTQSPVGLRLNCHHACPNCWEREGNRGGLGGARVELADFFQK